MKSVLITYNQAHTERIEYILDTLEIKGFTRWPEVHGRGMNGGEPRLNTHTWPETNSATITILEDEKVKPLFAKLRKLDEFNDEVGVRAFVWNIEEML